MKQYIPIFLLVSVIAVAGCVGQSGTDSLKQSLNISQILKDIEAEGSTYKEVNDMFVFPVKDCTSVLECQTKFSDTHTKFQGVIDLYRFRDNWVCQGTDCVLVLPKDDPEVYQYYASGYTKILNATKDRVLDQAACIDLFSVDRSSIFVSGNNITLLIKNSNPDVVFRNISATVVYNDNSVGVISNIISLEGLGYYTPITLTLRKPAKKITLLSLTCPQPIAEIELP